MVKPKKIKKGIPLPRTHVVIDHQQNGVKNILTVCGGSLTTHRSMAEDAVNQLGNRFGINTPCSTSSTPLLKNIKNYWKPSSYFSKVEKDKKYSDIICECESVTKSDIENLMNQENITDFHDIRRRIRVGFGPCQGTFCTSRLAEIFIAKKNELDFKKFILNFLSERLKGSMRTAYGEQAKQMLLSDYIYQENFGLQLNIETSEKDDFRI